jgi:hypothetical protein
LLYKVTENDKNQLWRPNRLSLIGDCLGPLRWQRANYSLALNGHRGDQQPAVNTVSQSLSRGHSNGGGIGTFADIEAYPLLEEGKAAWAACVARIQQQLAETACSVLSGFIRSDRLACLAAEGRAIAPIAWSRTETVNVYNAAFNQDLPECHPGRIRMERGNAFVARDHIPLDFLINRLFQSPPFQSFIAACFGMERVFELADPLAGLCLNVLKPGREHPWHFDTNEFTVSLLTQKPKAGGVFEYCPNIRSPKNENLFAVREVLEGRGARHIHRIVLEPGDLFLFRGRYTLHRVSPVEGEIERHSAILAYTKEPGVIGTPERTRQLFGRVLPIHAAAAKRSRGDGLLD